MKVRVYEKAPASELVVDVDARPSAAPGAVAIVAVDAKGNMRHCGALARFAPEGLVLMSDVDPLLGFPLDSEGRLKVVGAEERDKARDKEVWLAAYQQGLREMAKRIIGPHGENCDSLQHAICHADLCWTKSPYAGR